MKKRVKPAEARRILSKVRPEKSFWLCTGQELRNLEEVARAIGEIDNDVFRYHVNRDKNDFERWIRDVLEDKELAREISRIKTAETLQRKITERIEELRDVLRAAKPIRARRVVLKRKTRKTGRKSRRRAGKSRGKIRRKAKKSRGRTKQRGKRKKAGRKARKSKRKGRKARQGRKGKARPGPKKSAGRKKVKRRLRHTQKRRRSGGKRQGKKRKTRSGRKKR